MEARVDARVDALPDEILTLVFSKLTDGRTLLDAVPLVCKRWRRVSRDPASWAGVQLQVGAGDVADEARILRRAPAAKSLQVEALWARRAFVDKGFVRTQYAAGGRYGPLVRCRVRAALRFSRVTVRESVAILEKGWWVARLPRLDWPRAVDPKSSIARFLARQPGLRELRLYLAAGEEGAASLAAIKGMHRLEKLELTTAPGAAYQGELAGALPHLRELRLHAQCPRDAEHPEPPRGLVGDLVRGAPMLRVLEVDMPVGGADRAACSALRGVAQVALNAFQDHAGRAHPVKEAAVAAVRAAFSLLVEMKSPALQEATVSLCRGEHARYSVEWLSQCTAVLDEFSLQMPDVKLKVLVDGPDCSLCKYSADCPGLQWASEGSDNQDSDSDSFGW